MGPCQSAPLVGFQPATWPQWFCGRRGPSGQTCPANAAGVRISKFRRLVPKSKLFEMLMFVFRRGQGFSETKFAGESASKSDSICCPKSARKSMSISRLSTSKWRLAREAASKSDANLSRNLLANLCRNLNQTSRQFDET